MKILECKNLYKSYSEGKGRLEVLKGIDFELKQQEKIAITGESGSGKSTLLHLLGLLDKPDSGEILYWNEKVNFKPKAMAKLRNEKIGFIFQMHYLLNDFTALENVALPMFLKTKNMTESKKKAFDLLKRLEISERKDHYSNELSGGEQQRVAIARAIINNPDIVFADEPTGNLDERHSREILELISRLNKDFGQSFVIVTHNNQIAEMMDKHYFLGKSKLRQK